MVLHTRFGISFQTAGLLLAIAVVTATGCARDAEPPYYLSGRVIHNGAVVPSGSVTLVPDGTQGNCGLVVSTEIRDGKFDTRQSNGSVHGHVGGPYLIRITGLNEDSLAAVCDRNERRFAPTFGKTGERTFQFRLDFSEPPGLGMVFSTYEYKLDLPRENSRLEIVVPTPPTGRVPAAPNEL